MFLRTLKSGRHGAALLVSLCALAVAPDRSAAQEGSTCLKLVPGDAFGFTHIRYNALRASPWLKVLPEDVQRGMSEVHLPFLRGEAEEMVIVSSSQSFFGFGGGWDKRSFGVGEKVPPPKECPPPKEDLPPGKEECGGKKDAEPEEDSREPLFIVRLAKKFDPLERAKGADFGKARLIDKNGPLGGAFWVMEIGAMVILPDGMHVIYSFDARAIKNLRKTEGALSKVIAQIQGKDYVVALGVALSDKARAELKGELKEPFFGPEGYMRRVIMPFAELKSGFFTLSAGDRAAAHTTGVFTSPEAAKKGKLAMEDALALMRIIGLGEMERELHFMRARALTEERELEVAALDVLLEAGEDSLRQAKVVQEGATVSASASATIGAADVRTKAAALVKARADDPNVRLVRFRALNTNNLKQMAIAMHAFHDAYKGLPPQAICDKKTGKPLLSWRVAILPFIEQEALYRQFKLDEAWDSDHNIKLLDKLPEIYASPTGEGKAKGLTYWQVFSGKGSMFELTLEPKAQFGARGPELFRIPDGTSNTLMVVEAGKAVPWTKPEDIAFDGTEKSPMPALGGMSKEGFLAAFGDASVTFMRLPVPPRTLFMLIHRADGGTPDLKR